MTELNAKKRKALAKSDFAMPAERKYPIQDKAHAVAAKARATEQQKKGNLKASQAAAVKTKANKVIKKSK